MRVHLIVEQDDGSLMGLSSDAALVEIEQTDDLDDVMFGPGPYAVPHSRTTRLTLELHSYTVFRPRERPWTSPSPLVGRPAIGGPS